MGHVEPVTSIRHAGPASFSLHDLPAGDYGVHTYPSPQDRNALPLATDDPRGFVTRFGITDEAYATVEMSAHGATLVTFPTIGAFWTTMMLALVSTALRRRR